MIPLFLPLPLQVFMLEQVTTGIAREREFTWQGTQEDGTIFLNFSETEKNSLSCPRFEPQPPAWQASALSITPYPLGMFSILDTNWNI